MKCYRSSKDEVNAIDQAQRFKDINEGKKVRDFMFVYPNNNHKKRGVYRLKFDGNKFYIGRAKYIETRFKAHWATLNKFFATGEYPEEHFFRKVFEYLKTDQWAYYFEVELLEECYSVDELFVGEQKWLDKYKDDPNCLNVGFIAVKPANEIDETPEEQKERKANSGVARRGGRLVFYQKKKVSSAVSDRRSESFNKHDPKKKQAANSFSFNVPEMLSDKGPTVFKLFYDKKYIIHKGKTLAGSLFILQRNYGYFYAYQHDKESKYEKEYYHAFYEYIKKHPGKDFKIEIVFESPDAYDILVAEQKAINENIKDKKCLNANISGYIPLLNTKTGMHGWISPEQVERFYAYLASQ